MPTRILLVGSGGREHALAWKLASEPGVNEVIVTPGSDAIAGEPRVRCVPGIDPLAGLAIASVARGSAVELAVIGPEAPLAAGVADELREAGVATFGPSAAAAQIESSKAFCRSIAEAAGVPMATGRAFDDAADAVAYARELAGGDRGVVVKDDGLAAGKGVTVCATVEQAERAIRDLFESAESEATSAKVVIEERLDGREASLIVLSDGRDALALPAARDHKRLNDGDRGPNTGGMGGYSPLPDLPDAEAEELLQRIHLPILAALARAGSPFQGALYAGLMLTANGPRLLECNARFGDPETQLILPRLAVALGPLLLAAARGELDSAARQLRLSGSLLPAAPEATVGTVLASRGYPDQATAGDEIEGLEDVRAAGALVFHNGTRRRTDGRYETNGGRVLTIVSRGSDIPAARAAAERAVVHARFDGLQRRHDIGADLPTRAAAGFAASAARS